MNFIIDIRTLWFEVETYWGVFHLYQDCQRLYWSFPFFRVETPLGVSNFIQDFQRWKMDLLRSNVFVQPLFLKSCCLLFKKRYLCSACVKTCFFVFDPLYTTYLIGRLTRISRSTVTVVCISLETRSIASQPSVATIPESSLCIKQNLSTKNDPRNDNLLQIVPSFGKFYKMVLHQIEIYLVKTFLFLALSCDH